MTRIERVDVCLAMEHVYKTIVYTSTVGPILIQMFRYPPFFAFNSL